MDKRYRAEIYIDVFVPENEDKCTELIDAKCAVAALISDIPNAYIGSVMPYDGALKMVRA